MALRVVHWATGSVGVAAIKGVLEHPELELAGCWVHSKDKAGKDVGELIGAQPLGVTATNSIDDILALDADAVIYSPLLPNVEEVAALLVIQPGQVAGRRFHWDAVVADTVVVRITVNWLVGEENLDPAWSFGPAGERYEMEVRGNPNTFVTVKGWQPESVEEGLLSNPGVVATAAHCVNTIPATCAAEPGIATFFDLPLVTGRAAPQLASR